MHAYSNHSPQQLKNERRTYRDPTSGSLNDVYMAAINQVIILSSELLISYLALFNDLFTL